VEEAAEAMHGYEGEERGEALVTAKKTKPLGVLNIRYR
jgi:hypothetical protein